jgi:hypothetical protein
MKKEKLLYAIGQINEDYITDAEPGKKTSNKPVWLKYVAVAACLALALGLGITLLTSGNGEIELPLSTGNICVKYIEKAPAASPKADLEWLTEEELFTKYETAIFSGTIAEIRNIQIDYNGSIDYGAIAKISVENVYRGDCICGETVSVLLPGPVNMKGVWVEDTETISAMREGMRGIFMPLQYDDESFRSQNGATLYLNDIADYGFLDGRRCAFLETDEGLVFAREAYDSIAAATTLGEVENYILDMIP